MLIVYTTGVGAANNKNSIFAATLKIIRPLNVNFININEIN